MKGRDYEDHNIVRGPCSQTTLRNSLCFPPPPPPPPKSEVMLLSNVSFNHANIHAISPMIYIYLMYHGYF